MKKENKYKYIVTFKGAWIVEADSKKELIAKIKSPRFSRAVNQVKKIDATLGIK